MRNFVLPIIAAMCCSFAAAGATTSAAASADVNAIKPATATKAQLLSGLQPADNIRPRLAKIKSAIIALGKPKATKRSQIASLKAGLKDIDLLDQDLLKLKAGFEATETSIGSAIGAKASDGDEAVDANRDALGRMRAAFEAKLKELETKDRLGNFEIQDLMSTYNETETRASSVLKKADDTKNAVIQKIG